MLLTGLWQAAVFQATSVFAARHLAFYARHRELVTLAGQLHFSFYFVRMGERHSATAAKFTERVRCAYLPQLPRTPLPLQPPLTALPLLSTWIGPHARATRRCRSATGRPCAGLLSRRTVFESHFDSGPWVLCSMLIANGSLWM